MLKPYRLLCDPWHLLWMSLIFLPSQSLPAPLLLVMNSLNICRSLLRPRKILWVGGGHNVPFFPFFLRWLLITIQYQVSWYSFLQVLSRVDSIIATSTSVKYVFSQQRKLLLLTHFQLSASSIRKILCLGSWSRIDLFQDQVLIDAIAADDEKSECSERKSTL